MEPPSDVLADLDLRFIRSAPKDSLSSAEHLMFSVEHAYWFYEDHVREKNPGLRHYSRWQDFAKLLFHASPFLKQHVLNFDEFVERFRRYKRLIPVFGAMLMDSAMERVLLVRGYKSGSGWGFPRGKVNAGEQGIDCAAREVLEETGIDCESMLSQENAIQVTVDGKPHTLFIVAGIDPDTTVCAPKTKGEIGAYGWHYVKDLPATVNEANQVYMSSAGIKHKFFMVQPFVRPLREWIKNRKIQLGRQATKGAKGAKITAKSGVAAASVAAAAAVFGTASPQSGMVVSTAVRATASSFNQQQQATVSMEAQVLTTVAVGRDASVSDRSAGHVRSHAGVSPGSVLPTGWRTTQLSTFTFDKAAIMSCLAVPS